MAADPSDAEPLIDPVRAVLDQVEADIIEAIAVGLVAGLTTPQLRARLTTVVAGYVGRIPRLVGAALAAAFLTGQRTAEADIPKRDNAPRPPRRQPPRSWPTQIVVRQLVRQAPRQAGFTHQGRRVTLDDLNREVTDGMTANRYGTRRDAAADLLAKYARSGITGFRDTAGRSWDLASYAEVVTRTTTAQTLVDAHLDRLTEMGRDLVIVSDAPEECSICRPYEGKVLSISGDTRKGTHRIDGHTVTVYGTVADAKADGVWHPNCRHRVGIYLPGVTRPMGETADPEGAKLRAEQRRRERDIRGKKRAIQAVEAAAGKDSTQAQAARRNLASTERNFKLWREDHGRKNIPGRTSITAPDRRSPNR